MEMFSGKTPLDLLFWKYFLLFGNFPNDRDRVCLFNLSFK